MSNLELSEQEQLRRQSLAELRRMGIDPYPAAEYPVSGHSDEIKETFTDDAPQREVCVAGRIMSRRIMGKASFVELQDSRGRIQIYVSRDEICPEENKDLYNVVFKNFSTSAILSAYAVMFSALRPVRFPFMPRPLPC